jgi:hypothetical protein
MLLVMMVVVVAVMVVVVVVVMMMRDLLLVFACLQPHLVVRLPKPDGHDLRRPPQGRRLHHEVRS